MVREIHIYVEGGLAQGLRESNKTNFKDREMREGFSKFFYKEIKKRTGKEVHPKIKLRGGRSQAYEDFKAALKINPQVFNILLVDAETKVIHKDCRDHLRQRDKWNLSSVGKEHCHLMVQTMEAWFVADAKALKICFKQDFKASKLPTIQDVETIEKVRLMEILEAATNGKYRENTKLLNTGKILSALDPEVVTNKSKYCKALFDTLIKIVEEN